MILVNESLKSKKEVNAPGGRIIIEGPAERDYIASLVIDPNLNNFRNPTRQKEALMIVAELPEGMVYIARHGRTITGYVNFHYPSRYTRWSRHPRILELGAVEVSKQRQRQGIASALLEEAFGNKIMEEYIVIVTEFHQHWDLKGSKLNFWNYRKLLTKLYGSVGFKRKHTDDPEILEHSANMLMARVGRNVNDAYIKAFDELTYQQSLVD
jgi:acetoin utilization protein AcuA